MKDSVIGQIILAAIAGAFINEALKPPAPAPMVPVFAPVGLGKIPEEIVVQLERLKREENTIKITKDNTREENSE